MGTTLLPNLTLNMGENNVAATGYFQANDNDESLQTLNDFVGKRDVVLSIGGYDDSTQVHSLAKAFRTLSALNQHLASAVHDELEMICPGCTTEFALTSALVRHLESGVCGTASYASVQANARALIDTVSGLLKG